MRIMIVDDEQLNITFTQILLAKCDGVEVIGGYTLPYEALKDIPELMPDAIFVDIEMPEMNGIEFAKRVKQQYEQIQIVFVTAHESYAIKAFEIEALHYMLKPLSEGKIKQVVNRLHKHQVVPAQIVTNENKMRICTFGRCRVYGPKDDIEVQWPTAKARELFFIFVMHSGRELNKWELCEWLWPDSDSDKVEHRLHSTISRLRATLKEAELDHIVMRNQSTYRCDLSAFTCDLWDLQKLQALWSNVSKQNIASYKKVLEALQGQWLAHEDWHWINHMSSTIMQEYFCAIRKVVDYYIEEQDWRNAEQFNRRIIELWPYDEIVICTQLHIVEKLYGQRELALYYYTVVEQYEQEYDESPIVVMTEYERLRQQMIKKI